ncbi:phage tail sheath protein [Kiloniella laminariae]|uniref:Phage tail sheath protein n=1 Tax=Kiloniella laminariae TaxID=454162 RepID=A0ABT4LKR4_9PROT|nr:phage tail sheath protein [Kiloniella laminariae]MCZ4281696.1 phage tail sheath protein [Kiloniella laminariae]
MPADYHHGVRVIEINEGVRPIRTIETAVIGVVCTGPTADVETFPLNRPVLLTDVYSGIDKAGTNGTLPYVLDAIKDQCNPLIVVVRVEEGADEAATRTNVIGGSVDGMKTGLQALTAAKAQTGVQPRILGAPGLDDEFVTAELAGIAQQTRSFVYAAAHGAETRDDAVVYRDKFGQREVMIIWPDFISWDTTTSTTRNAWATARALGLRAKIDNEIGWHKTLSNVPVNGVTGLSKDIYFDLQSPQTDAGVLNANEVTTLINHKGFRFWGSRTCTADPLFAFESYTRTAQVLADTIADAHFWAVDKPMSVTLFKDIVNGVDAKLRNLSTLGYLIGGEAWFDPKYNPKELLFSGKAYVDYAYTPVPPLENLNFQQRITDRHLVDFAQAIAA